jgi:RHS repeat-associated protein
LWIRDARGNLVMQYITPARPNNATGEDMPANAAPCYDIAGNLLFQHSMDAGDRWMLMDAAGKPMLAWDEYKPKDDEAIVEKRLYATDYDQLHRPTAQWLTIDAKPRVKFERYEYQDAVRNDANNLNGQLIKHFDSSGLLETVRRDFKGNVEQVQRTLNNKPKESFIDWNANPVANLENRTFVQITQYDALNRMTRLFNWHRTGKSVAVYIPMYGERGVLKSERLIVGANKDNSPKGYRDGTENDAIQDIRYDAKGQRQYLKLGKGIITHYDYDPETFRLKQLRTTRPTYDPSFPDYHADLKDPNVLQQLHYTYDPVGNITEIHDEAYKMAYFQNAIIEPKNRYKYDALYRLIEATGREDGAISGAPDDFEAKIRETSFPITDANALRSYRQTYQCDSVGNIKQMHHSAGMGTWTRTNAYATDSNRLIKTTHRNQSTDIRYDSHGSMLNLANVADAFLMQWDHRDMIASINLGGGSFAYYQYDANKQRTRKYIEKNNGNIVEERIYLGGLEIFRQWVNGNLKQEIETLHLFDGEQRLLMVDQIDDVDKGKSTLYRYTLSNHLGSSTLELDEQAKLISYEEYHPYGTSSYRAGRNVVEVKLKRYRYTGMERDEESGLSYHSARYYLPWLGRWGSSDPAGMLGGLNIYAFVHCNPVKLVDTDGKAPKILEVTVSSWFEAHLQEFNWAYSKEVKISVNVGGQVVNTIPDYLAHPPGKPNMLFKFEIKIEHPDIPGSPSKFTPAQVLTDPLIETGKPFVPTQHASNISLKAGQPRSIFGSLLVDRHNATSEARDFIRNNMEIPPKPATPPKLNPKSQVSPASAGEISTEGGMEAPISKGVVVTPRQPSGGRGGSGPKGGQATVPGLMSMAGLSMTIIGLIQTKHAFDQAYEESVRQNSQKPLEDEAFRQAGSWGLGIGAGFAFSFAVKGAMGGAPLGPTGMAIGFFGGIAVGAFAGYLGREAAEAGIESGAVDPLRTIFSEPDDSEPDDEAFRLSMQGASKGRPN